MFTAEVRIVLSGEFCVTAHACAARSTRCGPNCSGSSSEAGCTCRWARAKRCWSATRGSLDARHAHALAAACNKATLETIQTAAESAGLEIAVIEPALSALARAVSRLPDVPAEPYLLVHLTESAMEIGVCHEGQLLLDYRPGGATGVVDLPALLRQPPQSSESARGAYLRAAPPGSSTSFSAATRRPCQAACKQFKPTLAARSAASCGRPTCKPRGSCATARPRSPRRRRSAACSLSYLPADECDAPNLMQHILDGKQEPLRPRLIRSALPLAATLLVAVALGVRQRAADATSWPPCRPSSTAWPSRRPGRPSCGCN